MKTTEDKKDKKKQEEAGEEGRGWRWTKEVRGQRKMEEASERLRTSDMDREPDWKKSITTLDISEALMRRNWVEVFLRQNLSRICVNFLSCLC